MTDLLKQLRPEMTSLLNCFSAPAVLLCSDYTVLAANQAYRRVFGDGKPLQGRRCYEIMAEAGYTCRQGGNQCPLDTCQRSGTDQHVVHSGTSGNAQIDLYPIRNDNAEVVYFLELLILIPQSVVQSAPAMVGNSPAWQDVTALIRRAAPSEAVVLLLGESGTGKELAAAAIHQGSRVRNGPFVAVDCSGLPETLFESELFGHEKGAFTGAHSRKIGLVEAANGGTLFLDEIGDIPLNLQVKLLRLLETGYFRRVGGVEPIRSQFRLISATHRPLERMVEEERFRQDLYYRLNTFPIVLPALRERLEDIPPLAEAILQRLPVAKGLQLHADTLDMLQHYDYPGNIRELRNIL
ncbi:MAG: AAA domain-containing protein, partial [Acidithiobacillus ferriphilus]|nr:AAA domain-containing protein [Acidithiobacillus ferriphilus]